MKNHRFLFASVFSLLSIATSGAFAATTINDSDDIGLNTSPATTLQLGGVVWGVSEPYVNLWVKAEPFGYVPSRGPNVTCDLTYKQRGARPFDDDPSFKPRAFSVGGVWTCSWISYVAYNDPGPTPTVYLAGGGSRTFTADGSTIDYVTNTKLSRNLSGGTVTSFERTFPSGAKEVFGFIVNGTGAKYAFRTALTDPSGNTVTFMYTTYTDGGGNLNVRLLYVIDPDSNLAYMTYGNSSYPNYITRIDDYFRRFATFQYDTNGKLQSVTDTGNLTTSFGYNGNVLTSYTTVVRHHQFRRHRSRRPTGRWTRCPGHGSRRDQAVVRLPRRPFLRAAGLLSERRGSGNLHVCEHV
jgi:YD repeat-containing protein